MVHFFYVGQPKIRTILILKITEAIFGKLIYGHEECKAERIVHFFNVV